MSPKFFLSISEVVQGDFNLQELNLVLVFQVNCPGCFVTAFPFANYLHDQLSAQGLKVMGLSTAFEDYEFNTLENTRKFLTEGELIGETKKLLSQNGYLKLPYKVDFAVAFDNLQPMKQRELTDEIVEKMCQTLPDYNALNFTERKLLRGQVKEYLRNKQFSAATFDTNDLRGTPSWILLDKDFEVYGKWFGHQAHKEIEELIRAKLS